MVKVTILDSGPEKNELNQNANGGTELMQNELYKRLDKDLLDNFQIICLICINSVEFRTHLAQFACIDCGKCESTYPYIW